MLCTEVDDEEHGNALLVRTRIFSQTKFPVSPGIIYEVPSEDESIVIGQPKYIKPYPDKDKTRQWYAECRAFDVRHQAKLTAKRQEERNLIEETLLPLRKIYMRTSYLNQTALEVLVLTYLRRGKLDDFDEDL